MALNKQQLTRLLQRTPSTATGPYITGTNLRTTVEEIVDEVNRELAALGTVNEDQDGNISRLAGHVVGSETLPVPGVTISSALSLRVTALEEAAPGYALTTALSDYVAIADLQALVEDCADFADFKDAIALLGT